MTRCPACGTDNPPDFRFCGGCGAPLTGQGCAACGFPNPPGQRFCGRCGAPQEASEPAIAERPTAERKLATILFADVVGFTSIAEQTDPEALARTVDAAFRRLGEIVVEHGGTVDKYMGDCLMAVFGVPTAHDDDAERAVAAALAMTGLDAELEFSIGINSGEVMVGAVGRDDSLTVMGDTVNVAARLEKTAGPGEVLLGPMTAELVADRVVLREREAAVLKGKRDPVPMWEAVALRPSTLAAECPPPLIGRDDELAFLRACWRRTVRGSRLQLILLTGPAGVGKTRLIDELASAVAPEALVVRTTCPGYGSLVRSRVGADLARQLGVTKEQPPPGAAPSAEPAPAAEGEEHNVWRMRRLIAERAAERPLLVAVDDLHHAQPSDLDPVTQLLARLGDVPVMVTLVGRPEPGAWLGRFPDATALHLDPLVFADAATLAAALAGDLRLASDSAERLAAQSGGNPLHLRELVRLLHSRGGLVAEDGQYRLDEHPLLPPSLHAVLGARLDALAPADKGTLQDVSVFSGGATITDVAALGTSDAEATLERLVTAGLLRQRDGGRYDVADPLLREVAYEALPRSARGDRHRRAAAVAATSQGRARHLGFAVDYLSDDTELRGEAALALAVAGRELIDSLRLREGTGLLARAVELGHEDVEDLLALARALVEIGHCEAALGVLQRLEGRTTSERMAVEALHLRGNALRPTDPERSIAVLLEAAERWQGLGDEAKRAWALTNQGMTLFDIGRIAAAAAAHEEALGIFRRLGDRSGAAAAGQLLALARLDDPRVPSWIDDGLHLAEETGNPALERNALIVLAWFDFLRNRLGGPAATAEAEAHAARLARVSADLGDPVFEVQARCVAAILHRLGGRLDDAAEEIRRARHAAVVADTWSTRLLEAAGFVVAVARGEDVAIPQPSPSADPIALATSTSVAEALLLAGLIDEARSYLAGTALGAGDSSLLARLTGVILAAVLIRDGRHDEAVTRLEAAIAAARSVEAWPSVVAAQALLAESAALCGDRERAAALLAEIVDDPGGLAGLLVARARYLLGDEGAGRQVAEGAAALAAPGLAPTGLTLTPAR